MTDKDEYVIINRTAIEKRIEWFENKKKNLEVDDFDEFNSINAEIRGLKFYLSRSTPLIPEIEKAFDAGSERGNEEQWEFGIEPMDKEDYISNLKLNI